jgi:glucokinase
VAEALEATVLKIFHSIPVLPFSGTIMKHHAIGIDLGGTNLKGIVIDSSGKGRHVTRVPTEAEKGGTRVLENILKLIGILLEKEGGSTDILGIGIGTPGFVDGDGTVIGGAENLPGWKGTNIYASIKGKFGLPAVAANDVTVAALAESMFGAGRGVKNMVCLALGTGIGGGIVIDGHLYKGTHGMAGELGHIVVQTDGIQCNCGLKGCVERYASATGIVYLAREFAAKSREKSHLADIFAKNGETVTSKTVYDYVAKKDPVAMKAHETACEMLARACGFICNALSPDRIVLGGGVMKAGRIISDEVTIRFRKHCWEAIAQRTDIVIAECGEDAGVLGAGAMVFDAK